MTGHKGARTHRAVVLVTDDFRLYHRVAPFFEAHGITILGVGPRDPVPASARAVLGGQPSDPRSLPVLPSLEATLLSVLAALDRRRQGRPYRRVVFGVDPGNVIGLAALADGDVLLVAESLSPEDAAERLSAWATGLRADSWEVHVGDGSPEVGRRLVRGMRGRIDGARVLLTPEEATTPWSPVTGSRHADAAVLIALRRPRPSQGPDGDAQT